jgi:hypothetical protein
MHRALRQTGVYFLTIAASQGLSFLLLPVVTAYVSPETYGDYTLALSLSGPGSSRRSGRAGSGTSASGSSTIPAARGGPAPSS